VLIAYAVWEFFPLILLLTTVAAGACVTKSAPPSSLRDGF